MFQRGAREDSVVDVKRGRHGQAGVNEETIDSLRGREAQIRKRRDDVFVL